MPNTTVSLAEDLIHRLDNHTAQPAVIGLGYVGLPLAVELASAGLTVVSIDVDASKVARLSRGESYIPDVPSAKIEQLVGAGKLRATTDFSVLADADTINICVPTPLRKTRDPDMSYVVSAANRSQSLRPGHLVILESTTYPGTTEEVLLPMMQAGGLRSGRDFFLAFSPERVDPGNPRWHTGNIPKVVGGIDEVSTRVAAALYRQFSAHRARLVREGGRDGEAAREHVPRGEHRHGERARAHVP